MQNDHIAKGIQKISKSVSNSKKITPKPEWRLDAAFLCNSWKDDYHEALMELWSYLSDRNSNRRKLVALDQLQKLVDGDGDEMRFNYNSRVDYIVPIPVKTANSTVYTLGGCAIMISCDSSTVVVPVVEINDVSVDRALSYCIRKNSRSRTTDAVNFVSVSAVNRRLIATSTVVDGARTVPRLINNQFCNRNGDIIFPVPNDNRGGGGWEGFAYASATAAGAASRISRYIVPMNVDGMIPVISFRNEPVNKHNVNEARTNVSDSGSRDGVDARDLFLKEQRNRFESSLIDGIKCAYFDWSGMTTVLPPALDDDFHCAVHIYQSMLIQNNKHLDYICDFMLGFCFGLSVPPELTNTAPPRPRESDGDGDGSRDGAKGPRSQKRPSTTSSPNDTSENNESSSEGHLTKLARNACHLVASGKASDAVLAFALQLISIDIDIAAVRVNDSLQTAPAPAPAPAPAHVSHSYTQDYNEKEKELKSSFLSDGTPISVTKADNYISSMNTSVVATAAHASSSSSTPVVDAPPEYPLNEAPPNLPRGPIADGAQCEVINRASHKLSDYEYCLVYNNKRYQIKQGDILAFNNRAVIVQSCNGGGQFSNPQIKVQDLVTLVTSNIRINKFHLVCCPVNPDTCICQYHKNRCGGIESGLEAMSLGSATPPPPPSPGASLRR